MFSSIWSLKRAFKLSNGSWYRDFIITSYRISQLACLNDRCLWNGAHWPLRPVLLTFDSLAYFVRFTSEFPQEPGRIFSSGRRHWLWTCQYYDYFSGIIIASEELLANDWFTLILAVLYCCTPSSQAYWIIHSFCSHAYTATTEKISGKKKSQKESATICVACLTLVWSIQLLLLILK